MSQFEAWRYTHPAFQLNGESHSIDTLKNVATSFMEAGISYKVFLGQFLLDWLDTNNQVVVTTSGSTGTPKPIKIDKQYMINSARATGSYFDLPHTTKALLCLPAHFIAGKMMLVRALVLGWHIDITKPTAFPLEMVNTTYDFCAMTPLQLGNSLLKLHFLKKLIVGGGAIPVSLKYKIRDISTNIFETYGMTETVTHIAARSVNCAAQTSESLAFTALENVTIKTDARGCLVIYAPHVSKGAVITNDLVEIIALNKFYWFGRIDNVINSGGVKLHPEQIEQKLEAVLTTPFFITSLPDPQLGARLVLFIEQEKPFTDQALLANLTSLDRFEHPKQVITTRSFLRTPTGKIKREETLKRYLKTNAIN